VADLAYLLPEGAPPPCPFGALDCKPAPPDGYDYDYINTDVLLNRMSVGEDGPAGIAGRHELPRAGGFPEIDRMTPRVLRKIHRLGGGRGATVVGPKPMEIAEPGRITPASMAKCWRWPPICGGEHRRSQRQPAGFGRRAG